MVARIRRVLIGSLIAALVYPAFMGVRVGYCAGGVDGGAFDAAGGPVGAARCSATIAMISTTATRALRETDPPCDSNCRSEEPGRDTATIAIHSLGEHVYGRYRLHRGPIPRRPWDGDRWNTPTAGRRDHHHGDRRSVDWFWTCSRWDTDHERRALSDRHPRDDDGGFDRADVGCGHDGRGLKGFL